MGGDLIFSANGISRRSSMPLASRQRKFWRRQAGIQNQKCRQNL
jgi:hypothetical protein